MLSCQLYFWILLYFLPYCLFQFIPDVPLCMRAIAESGWPHGGRAVLGFSAYEPLWLHGWGRTARGVHHRGECTSSPEILQEILSTPSGLCPIKGRRCVLLAWGHSLPLRGHQNPRTSECSVWRFSQKFWRHKPLQSLSYLMVNGMVCLKFLSEILSTQTITIFTMYGDWGFLLSDI